MILKLPKAFKIVFVISAGDRCGIGKLLTCVMSNFVLLKISWSILLGCLGSISFAIKESVEPWNDFFLA